VTTVGETENVRLWREINAQGKQMVKLEAECGALSERVSVLDGRLAVLESWRSNHDTYAVATDSRLTAALASLSRQLEDRVTIEKSRWDKVWTVVQPLLTLLMMALLTLIGLKVGAHP
jgi:hypothetical protein